MAESINGSLEQVLPQPVEVMIRGESISILPIKVRNLPSVMKHMAGFSRYLKGEEVDMLTLMSEGANDLIHAVSAASGVPVERLLDFEMDELVRLTRVVIEVNSDFFSKAVLPEIRKTTETLSNCAGLISSRG